MQDSSDNVQDASHRRQRFRPYERLRRRRDIARVFSARRSAGDQRLVVYVLPNDLPWSRLGISVSRRIGGAVTRNYVRRRIREAFRRNKEALPKGYDVICVAKRPAADPREDIAASLIKLVARAVNCSRSARRPSDKR